MGNCCFSFLKFLVVICNLVYMLLGLLLMAVTLYVYIDEEMVVPVSPEVAGYTHVLYFIMIIAGIMTIMGFLGCCGALYESQCMLATFFALNLVIFLGQVCLGVLAHQNSAKFYGIVKDSVTVSLQREYGVPGKETKTKAFDVLQEHFMCCGANGPDDWADSTYSNGGAVGSVFHEIGVPKVVGSAISGALGAYTVPATCCKGSVDHETCENIRKVKGVAAFTNNIYSGGCVNKILDMLKAHNTEVLGVVMAILLVEVMAMVFSLVLCCTVRRVDNFKA